MPKPTESTDEADLCPFRYVCGRGHELDSAEPLLTCPEPCGADLVRTLGKKSGYLSPDERLRAFGTPYGVNTYGYEQDEGADAH